ncbi:MAG: hypothetical protein IPG56_17065 [Caulobacteraceae bacterium]|nr:hypothetical protein [Caulobacteraceae bacterium]
MIRTYLAATAALLLAACGQSTAPTTEEAPAAPQGLLEQIQAQSPEAQSVIAYHGFHRLPDCAPRLVVTPPCTSVRGTDRITVPANVAPDSIYAPHVGQVVFTVQCGALISATRMDYTQKWLVSFAPGAPEATVEHCLGPRESDLCPRNVPTADPAPATTTP